MKIQISEDQYEKLKKDIKKDDTSKFITCKNCKKKFTQTIHKGKKSDPICPTCGTYNKEQ
jgi:rubrerythrin